MTPIHVLCSGLMVLSCFTSNDGASTASTPTEESTTVTDAPETSTRESARARCSGNEPVDPDYMAQRLSVLEKAFKPEGSGDYRRALDVAFIVDRSQSTGSNGLAITKKVIISLINKLSELQYIFIHRNYTRVAVVSFAGYVTVDIDGISSANQALDACILNERIADLQVNQSFTPKSEVAQAMSRVASIMTTSKSDPDRPDPDQVVWMFFDGECNPDTPLQCQHSGKHMNEWAGEMRNSKIQIFTAGIGEWLNSDEKERQIQSLATDVDHYACATTWADIIPKLNDQTTETPQAPLFNEIAEVYKSRCQPAPCPTGLDCACDVLKRTYTCTDKPKVLLNPVGPSVVIVRTTGEPPPAWLMPVAIGSSVGGFILLLILLITLPILAIKRKRERKEEERFLREQPIYGGPSLPPPPIRRPLRQRFVDQSQASENIYADPAADPSYPAELENRFDDSKDYAAISYPQDYIDCTKQNVEEMDNDMKGWAGQLAYIKQSNSLLHMAVRSIPKDRWAKTSGSPVTERDFREMEKIMRTAETNPTNHKMKIGTKAYEVDKANLSTNQIHATRFIHKGLKEVVWVSKVYDYVIVGIANDSEDENCVRAVHEIHKHLKSSIEFDFSNITGTPPEEGIYTMQLPQRYSRMANSPD